MFRFALYLQGMADGVRRLLFRYAWTWLALDWQTRLGSLWHYPLSSLRLCIGMADGVRLGCFRSVVFPTWQGRQVGVRRASDRV